MNNPTDPDVWAVVELMGHIRLAGKLTEEEKFGVKMGRLDIPTETGFMTQMFGGQSVYRISIVTEAVARQVSRQASPAPVSPWDFPKQLTLSDREANQHFDTDEERDDDEGSPY